MRPTRRGYAVAAVVAVALAVGAAFGARSLDAVVLPAAVALVAATAQVWRAPMPTVERVLPPADGPGTAGTVELRFDAPRTYPATVRDRLPPGVGVAVGVDSGDGEDAAEGRESRGEREPGEAVVDASIGGSVRYEVARRRRGRHEIGPVTVVVTDVLGLVERTLELDARDELLVFPSVASLSGTAEASLRALTQSHRASRRDEFDDLREYVRGDALRDVHWKSSAKRGELMIREFTAATDPDRVAVVAGVADADPGDGTGARNGADAGPGETVDATTAADAMAEAAATVCLALLRDGATVELATPDGEVAAGADDARAVLDHLAGVGGGPVPRPDADPDVAVVVSGGEAVVRFDGREHRFGSLVSEDADRAGDAGGTTRIASTTGDRRDGGPIG